jgi:hypothetical protein
MVFTTCRVLGAERGRGVRGASRPGLGSGSRRGLLAAEKGGSCGGAETAVVAEASATVCRMCACVREEGGGAVLGSRGPDHMLHVVVYGWEGCVLEVGSTPGWFHDYTKRVHKTC